VGAVAGPAIGRFRIGGVRLRGVGRNRPESQRKGKSRDLHSRLHIDPDVLPQLQHLFGLFPREQVLVFRYRALIDDPARVLDRVCAFLGVPWECSASCRENVTAHPDPTLRHRAVAAMLRAGSAVTAALPGHAGSGVLDHLERIPQQDAAPRRPLTWQERQQLIPHFETDIRLGIGHR
jgi:hypothetical protein